MLRSDSEKAACGNAPNKFFSEASGNTTGNTPNKFFCSEGCGIVPGMSSIYKTGTTKHTIL